MLKELFDSNKFLICAGLSTFSLIFSTISIISISKSTKEVSKALEPISIWADSQNECITKTFRINGKNTQGIPSKVWSCNGGGE
ncbi:hypothetical protein [Prochlorococcus marinus]|uniref:Uncharacterized protein n=1 Tax=Prochlorococcus marinus XMU1408 TaxID=2213228 RepID=A0A318R4S0_PROMR|nr:hypothetical protein [Prochlorococcus marinus]MBW3042023.1 hypothetical protein [Prochlorococcus marinus str. XMU1408]PYE03144.1 hypothetical protein DNJ73_05250 [Prochlorococcus marinus XMU1408]